MSTKTEKYWTKRLVDNQYKKYTKELEKETLKIYKEAQQTILSCVKEIWLDMLSEDNVSISNLYKFNRLSKLEDVINSEINKLSKTEINLIEEKLKECYIQTLSEAMTELGSMLDVSYAQFNKEVINSIVNANFKGAEWSDRIWKNQDRLREMLKQKIIDSTVAGLDIRKVSKELSKRMNVSLNDSKRIIRTETIRVLNDSCLNAAKERGYTHYEFLAATDERTSEECKNLNGKVFEINRAIVGVNMPPIHPNCRSTILPIVFKG